MDTEIYSSSSEEETFQLGERFSERLSPGDVVAFNGDLGAGKTEFIKGICEEMRVEEIVSSPAYTIVNQYAGESADGTPTTIYHIDLYRIEGLGELTELGFQEIMADPTAVKLIEWPHNAGAFLPTERWEVSLASLDDESARRIEITHCEPVAVHRATGTYGGR